MSDDDEYATLPKHNFEVRDVTEPFGKELANLINNAPHLNELAFPRLQLPALKKCGYAPDDYRTIASLIGPNRIEVYETREFDMPFLGKYYSYASLTAFIVTPSLRVAPGLCMSTIIHETTHAIQDWKKWRMSEQDTEVDAHFAEALYLILNNKENEVADEPVINKYVDVAKSYRSDEGYLTTLEFRRLRRDLRDVVHKHYKMMKSTFQDQFDPKDFDKKFRRRKRLDGI